MKKSLSLLFGQVKELMGGKLGGGNQEAHEPYERGMGGERDFLLETAGWCCAVIFRKP
jgi:hypothetical protein